MNEIASAPVLSQPLTTAGRIDDFLAQNRIALIGVSREAKGYSRMLFRELRLRGYDVIPVNPQAMEIEGAACVGSVLKLEIPPKAALLLLPEEPLFAALDDCIQAGIPRVWVPFPPRRTRPRLLEKAVDNNLKLVLGFCPMMFLPGTGLMHRFHGFLETHGRAYRN